MVAGKATDIYSWAVSGATLKMKLFRLALIGTGIGGIIDSASGVLPPAKVFEDLFSYINQMGKSCPLI